MFEFVLLSHNYPFSIAIMLMLGLCALELVSLLLGAGLFQAIDSMLDTDLELEMSETNWISHCLEFGKVPLLVVIVVYLTMFGVSGWAFQALTLATIGFVLPGWIAALIVALLVFKPCKGICRLIGRVFPKVESTSVSEKSG